jgi:RTX calcium-binding nonapeptide repeat (4 copies)
MSRVGLAALVATCAALAQPASSLAATVGVEELPTEPRQAKVAFAGASGEANRLTVSIAGEEGLFYDLRLLDTAAPIQPGPGCSGGGAAGVAVQCKVHKPTPGDHLACFKGCRYTPGTKWELSLTFKLGDAGSRLDTTALPAGSSDPQQPWAGAFSIWVTVTPGAGDDTVLTGPGPDVIESSSGADLVRTGDGSDKFEGGPIPDGPDDVDLGENIYDSDAIDYSERNGDIRYDPNGLADDGGAGEGDNLGVAATVQTGSGADVVVGSPEPHYRNRLIGGGGDDTIHGGSGADEILGGEGDDELFGEEGNDYLIDPSYDEGGSSGNDTGSGGPGDDEIELGGGDDEVFGGAGEDRIESGPGDDSAAGGPGRDRIALGPGKDRGAGGAGGDLVLGEQGGDEIHGERGDDRLSGDVGRDSLFGGAGDDRIAAGMVVAHSRNLREFLGSRGPLEGKPDRIDCGAGRDGVKAGPGDSAAGCESIPRAELIELQGLIQSNGYTPTRLRAMIRRAGTAELEGKDVQPRRFVNKYDYARWGVPLQPVGRSLKALIRDGHVKLRLKLSFHAVDGRVVVRFRTVDLRLPVKLHSHHPVP